MGVGNTGPLAAFVEIVKADWLLRTPSVGRVSPRIVKEIGSTTPIGEDTIKLKIPESNTASGKKLGEITTIFSRFDVKAGREKETNSWMLISMRGTRET